MSRYIFVNLAVKDLPQSIEFFTKVGFTFDPNFSDNHGTMMNIDENIKVMLLTHEFYKSFIQDKEIADTSRVSECLVALSADSREEVDEILEKALAAGATENKIPNNESEFMYGRDFTDLDGHIWEIMWMDASSYLESQGN